MTLQSASSTQNSLDGIGRTWFVATVRPRHDHSVAHALQCRGIEPFAPTYRIERKHLRADRRTVHPPLFPGYVFCRFNRAERPAVLKTPGLASIVSVAGQPAAVPLAEIERIRTLVKPGRGLLPAPYLEAGHRIRIERGPMRGIEGHILQIRNDWRLVVGVALLRQSISVIVDRDAIGVLTREK